MYTTTATNTISARPAARSRKTPGKAGAIARLLVMGLICLISFASCFFTLPKFIGKVGFVQAIVDSLGGFGILLLVAAYFWLMMKWIGFSMPKMFGAAKSFWSRWIPLTFFGLYIKFCVFIFLIFLPLAAICALFSPLLALTAALATKGVGILSALGLLAAGLAVVFGCTFWDVCKLRQVQPLQAAQHWLRSVRASK